MTLCTIPDVGGALHELRRVLKPGASFHFAEHGHAPDDRVAHRQDRFNGLQRRIAGGCNLNRDITDAADRRRLRDRGRAQLLPEGPEAVELHVRGPGPEPVTARRRPEGALVYSSAPEG